ncbi:MAG: aldehyde ferredoxin oxidoreductase C-terminal domain-containing protein, partial [Bacteroidota bacterium]
TFSATLKNNKMVEGSEEWAGRGGSGSVLYQAHGVVGIVFGGEIERKFPGFNLSDADNVKDILNKYYNESYIKVIKRKTTKYRYNPKIGSGGTFGSNIHCLGEFIPLMNWKMIYMPRDERISIHNELMDKYWKPFNKESMEPRNWTTCGEPCPVVCKKHRDGQHVDYEPYEAGGPLAGSYEIHKTDTSIHKIDSMGFDAIEFGNLSAWILELISEGLLSTEELSLSHEPKFDMENFDFDKDSEINANLVAELAESVAYGKTEVCKILRLGQRKAARRFDEMFKNRLDNHRSGYTSYRDFAVYVPFGDEGGIAPTMYWAVGNFVPVPIQGKYLTYYQFGFFEPEMLAGECLNKAVKEFDTENTGMCRFHRNWATEIIPMLLKKAWGIDIDDNHNREILKKMIEYDKKSGIKPSFWDSQRVIDVVAYSAKEFGNKKWWEKFEKDKEGAAREYWSSFLRSYEEKLDTEWDYGYQIERGMLQ